MPERTKLIPGPDHPIVLDRVPNRVVVRVGDTVVADTTRALGLAEARYPVALYIPREDVAMALLTPSQTHTYCPYKGDASYYSIPAGGSRSVDAVWTYEAPFESVRLIKDHVSFYPDRVSSIEQIES